MDRFYTNYNTCEICNQADVMYSNDNLEYICEDCDERL